MKTNNIILIQFSLYKYGVGDAPHPRDIITPDNVIDRWWVPQTMSDSIWIFYEFNDTSSKELFLSKPDGVFKKATIRNENNKFINEWINQR